MDKTDSALDVDCFPGSIPGREDERERILAAVRSYVSERELVPPLTFEDVRDHGQSVLQAEDLPQTIIDSEQDLVRGGTGQFANMLIVNSHDLGHIGDAVLGQASLC